MTATRYDLCIPQSGVYQLVVNVVDGPSSLVGYGGEMQIRKTKSSATVLAEMQPGYFVVDDVNRQLVLTIPDTATETYDWDGLAVYDLYLVGPDRWRMLEGRARLDKTVTKEN